MSKCISREGEYSEHTLTGDGEHCDYCGELDLAAHDRAVKAEAWDEAVAWTAEHARQIKAWRATGGHYTPDHEDEYNPYRADQIEGATE